MNRLLSWFRDGQQQRAEIRLFQALCQHKVHLWNGAEDECGDCGIYVKSWPDRRFDDGRRLRRIVAQALLTRFGYDEAARRLVV